MKINILSFASIREIVGSKNVEIEVRDGSTIWDVILNLVEKIPILGNEIIKNNMISNSILVLHNEGSINLNELNSIIMKDGDELALLPPTGGG